MNIFSQKEIDDFISQAVNQVVKEAREQEVEELKLMFSKSKYFSNLLFKNYS